MTQEYGSETRRGKGDAYTGFPMAKPRRPHKGPKGTSAQAVKKREEARRLAAERRREKAKAEERRKALRRRIRRIATPVLAGVVVFAAAILLLKPSPEVPGVTKVDPVEGEALAPGSTQPYDTATPTSGPYASEAPACGVYAEPLALEQAVAALRTGAVVIWHQPGAFTDELADYAAEFDSHVIVSPHPDLGGPIVATAFLRLKAYDTIEQLVDDDFAGVYRTEYGEDKGDCPMTVGSEG